MKARVVVAHQNLLEKAAGQGGFFVHRHYARMLPAVHGHTAIAMPACSRS
jgi:hypothetical protein